MNFDTSVSVRSKIHQQWQTLGLLLLFLGMILFLFSCKDEKNNNNNTDLDQTALLENYADNLIIPSYQVLKEKVDSLNTVTDAFAQNPDLQKLEVLQRTFRSTYRNWQNAELYEFGPAANVLLRSSFNTFPTDTFSINQNIASGNYNLDAASNIDAVGLPALDYLLFGVRPDNNAIVAYYSDSNNGSNRLTYFQDLVSEIKTKSSAVLQEWEVNYRDAFVQNTGTDIGSSLSLLVNQFNFEYELIKNPKIGIPLGVKSLDQEQPGRVEALYSGVSIELALENMDNIIRVFKGESLNTAQSGTGLENYLDDLGAKYSEDQLLSEAILNQFDNARTAISAIPEPLKEAVQNNKSLVQSAYDEIQKAVVLIKTDMTSAMGIQITYQDNDGD